MDDRSTMFFYTMPLIVTASCMALFIVHGWYLAHRRRARGVASHAAHPDIVSLGGMRATMPAIANVGGAVLVILLLVGAALSAYA